MKKAFAKGYKSDGAKNPYPCGSRQHEQWEKGWVSAFIDNEIDGKRAKRIPKSFTVKQLII